MHLASRDREGEVGWSTTSPLTGFDFDEKTAELAAAGIRLQRPSTCRTPISARFFVLGPEGMRIELQCPPRPEAVTAIAVMISVTAGEMLSATLRLERQGRTEVSAVGWRDSEHHDRTGAIDGFRANPQTAAAEGDRC